MQRHEFGFLFVIRQSEFLTRANVALLSLSLQLKGAIWIGTPGEVLKNELTIGWIEDPLRL